MALWLLMLLFPYEPSAWPCWGSFVRMLEKVKCRDCRDSIHFSNFKCSWKPVLLRNGVLLYFNLWPRADWSGFSKGVWFVQIQHFKNVQPYFCFPAGRRQPSGGGGWFYRNCWHGRSSIGKFLKVVACTFFYERLWWKMKSPIIFLPQGFSGLEWPRHLCSEGHA